MIVENIDINLLKPYSNNPRKLTPKAIEKVAQSLKEFGFRQPIVVDANNTIVVGHTRYQASRKLGYTTVPITKINNLTKEQINAYRIADNRTNEEAEWDDELLALEIKELEMKDFDLELTGMNKPEIDELLFQEKQGNTDDDEVFLLEKLVKLLEEKPKDIIKYVDRPINGTGTSVTTSNSTSTGVFNEQR